MFNERYDDDDTPPIKGCNYPDCGSFDIPYQEQCAKIVDGKVQRFCRRHCKQLIKNGVDLRPQASVVEELTNSTKRKDDLDREMIEREYIDKLKRA